jgi:uncharacterized protein (AIM24 family)
MLAHKLVGNAMQMTVVQLEAGQTVYCEAGKFLWKTVNVGVETRLTKPNSGGAGGGAGGGFLGGLMDVGKRMLAGESAAFQYYSAAGGNGLVAFAGFKTGRKGGEGFVLEKFSGTGTLFIAGAGNFIELNPAKYGGKIQVDTGCVVAFQDTIQYGVERVGALNAQTAMTGMFGGEGLNLATLEGDGTVIIQSLTMKGLGQALSQFIGGSSRDSNPNNPLGTLFGGGND